MLGNEIASPVSSISLCSAISVIYASSAMAQSAEMKLAYERYKNLKNQGNTDWLFRLRKKLFHGQEEFVEHKFMRGLRAGLYNDKAAN